MQQTHTVQPAMVLEPSYIHARHIICAKGDHLIGQLDVDRKSKSFD